MSEIRGIGSNDRITPIEKTLKSGDRRPGNPENSSKKGKREVPLGGPDESHLGNNVDVKI